MRPSMVSVDAPRISGIRRNGGDRYIFNPLALLTGDRLGTDLDCSSDIGLVIIQID